ncbi:MAG: single-stranded-DNA-specific exonuclease RecJ [Clostridiales bacterium]|nr:single-stranded-DNA-specific exonuclease RecJ [Clostridiales bacterium]
MKYDKWHILPGNPEGAAALEEAGIPALAALVLSARGCATPEEARSFLRRDAALLHDPFLLRDMDRAAARVTKALEQGERICVYGDYDVDGITATCLLTAFLAERGGDVRSYIPNRLTEGYSLNSAAVRALGAQGVTLIVTVDCGITNVEEVALAASLGIDVVVTDHHECKEQLPAAVAVVDPHRPDCTYPDDALAGVGVALKLALAMTTPARREAVLLEYCDLAAVGTVADVMRLQGENRAIVSLGLARLERGSRPGFTALLREAGQEGRAVTAGTVSFSLAPRINAAGRMGCPELAARLLLTRDPAEAENRARQLCALNRDRQAVESEIYEECLDHLARHPEAAQGAIVLASPRWHQGVTGIVASRLTERYKVPAFMICLEDGRGKGSCRSWGQFNLFHALEQCSELLEGFGGHELAAGFTIREENIPAFRDKMSALAQEWYAANPADTALTADVLLPDARLLTLEQIQALELLEPHGAGNPSPVFVLEQATVTGLSRVGGGRHTRLQLRKNGALLDGIFFSATPEDAHLALGRQVDVAFHAQINEFRGIRSVQLQITDCRSARMLPEEALYRRYRAGSALTVAELERLIPDRGDFVAVWRYLSHSGSGLRENPLRLSQNISRTSGRQEALGRTMVCLEVFRERGLIDLRGNRNSITVTIRKTDQKVDLEASEILIRLRRKRAEG